MSSPVLRLSGDMAAMILKAAERAYPSECCGLIEGEWSRAGGRALVLHEAPNLADNPDRHFLIDPGVQFAVLRALRGTERRLIGCYHSHPDGAPEPSETDLASALESDFLWLIAAGSPVSGFTLRGYVLAGTRGFVPVALEED